MSEAPIRILTVSDSESYLKWSAAWLDQLGANVPGSGIVGESWLMDNPILPTPEQVVGALAGTSQDGSTPPVVARRDLRERMEAYGPDIVLAGATGPVVQQIFATGAALTRRPGLVSGLPGVGLPATTKGARYRRLGDMFVTHSHHERHAYLAVSALNGVPYEVVVSRLPMLRSQGAPVSSEVPVERIIFAPQAKVPFGRADRLAILLALADAAANGTEVIIKVRALAGEQQTHREEYPFVELLADAEQEGVIRPGLLQVAGGALSGFLQPGSALVTVSSTAALEAVDRGLPILIIGDFGVNEEMLNEAFRGSGVIGTLDDLREGRFAFPGRSWLEENYFHREGGELAAALRLLAARSRARQLPTLTAEVRMQDVRRVRAELRTWAPRPVVSAYRAGRSWLERRWHG